MTIPFERTQTVLRTRELLKKLAFGEGRDPEKLRRRVEALQKHLPTAVDISLSAGMLPTLWANTFADSITEGCKLRMGRC